MSSAQPMVTFIATPGNVLCMVYNNELHGVNFSQNLTCKCGKQGLHSKSQYLLPLVLLDWRWCKSETSHSIDSSISRANISSTFSNWNWHSYVFMNNEAASQLNSKSRSRLKPTAGDFWDGKSKKSQQE